MMKNYSAGKKKIFTGALIICSVSALVIVLDLLGVFSYTENKTYDSRVNALAGLRRPSEDIIVILVDQPGIDWAQQEKGWNWPWPRAAYADIVRFMERADAAAIVFDMLYTEPSVYGSSDDAAFAEASRSFGRTVQTVFFSTQSGNASAWPENIPRPGLRTRGFSAEPSREEKAQFPISELAEAACMLGCVTEVPDSDGIFRRSSLFRSFGGMSVPSLSVAAYMTGMGEQNADIVRAPETGEAVFAQAGLSLPAGERGDVLLRFRGSLDRYIPYSAAHILQSFDAINAGGEPLLEPELFTDKYVFFGIYAPGLFDLVSTPVLSVYPGVGIHVTALDNMLSNDFIRPPPRYLAALLAVIAAAAGVFLVAGSRKLLPSGRGGTAAAAAGLILAACLFTAAAFAAYAAGLWLPLVAPLTALAVSFLATLLVHYGTEGKEKRYLKTAFRQYLSPVVIDELVAHPERLKLGGERKEISIFFSDLQGFTSISEKLEPEELTSFLNEYLSAMSDIILDSGGTIDKYEGDAIIAFWNAPTAREDHAKRALEAASACQKRLDDMRPAFRERLGTDVYMRIGVNTGFAVVGNMGSHSRFDYTMLGDSVNLAARLEGLNKQFGTYTMCSLSAAEAARAHGFSMPLRELARAAVVGKKEAVTVFEVLSDAEYTEKKETLDIFSRALSLFYEGDIDAALPAFESVSTRDRPAFFYAQKCRELAAAALPGDWDGVWTASSK